MEARKRLVNTTPDSDKLTVLREIHTIKGNARVFGLDEISDLAHRVENAIVNDVSTGTSKLTVLDLSRLVEDYYQIFIKTFQHKSPNQSAPRTIADIAAEVHKSLAPICTQQLINIPELAIDQGNLLVKPSFENLVLSVLVQLMRNSLSHGLESPRLRREFGKEPSGTISIELSQQPQGVQLCYKDDGRGLAIAKLAEILKSKGHQAQSLNQIANSIFQPELSTAPRISPIAGRGVGLDLIRKLVEEQGGGIRVVVDSKADQDYCPFYFVIDLPKQIFTEDQGHFSEMKMVCTKSYS